MDYSFGHIGPEECFLCVDVINILLKLADSVLGILLLVQLHLAFLAEVVRGVPIIVLR